ncbi:hypothetical protein WICPIJ_002371 [Wickerhamomyces pijperi]|uniref:Uncharacterized protein n=1 Tax=Wickerhamomyces pijperi TaxID=599730 RepID=A0A9P8Q9B0_WICPI|nr:hypothetical protein WICPIJ_002371 [Wickerhamomyces pijperi]
MWKPLLLPLLFLLSLTSAESNTPGTTLGTLSSDITEEELHVFLGDESDAVFDLLFVKDEDDYINYFDPSELLQRVSISELEQEDILKNQNELEGELKDLYLSLESLHGKLINLANVLVDLKAEDYERFADNLEMDPDYKQLLESTSATTGSLKHNELVVQRGISVQSTEVGSESEVDDKWEYLFDEDVEDYADRDGVTEEVPEESLIVYSEPQNDESKELATAAYWNPDEEYEMLYQALMMDEEDEENPDISAQVVVSVVKNIKKKLKKKKIKMKILMKLIRLKKLVKRKIMILILKIMMLIEKNKRTLKLIIRIIKKDIRNLIHIVAPAVLKKIKKIIKLVLIIIEDLLWDIQMKILRMLLKLTLLLKKINVKLPIELLLYFKTSVFDMLGYHSEQKDVREQEMWDFIEKKKSIQNVKYGWDEYYDEGRVEDREKLVSYQPGGDYASPQAIDGVFVKKLGEKEMKLLTADSFNFDIEYYGRQIDDIGFKELDIMNLLLGSINHNEEEKEKPIKSKREVKGDDTGKEIKEAPQLSNGTYLQNLSMGNNFNESGEQYILSNIGGKNLDSRIIPSLAIGLFIISLFLMIRTLQE